MGGLVPEGFDRCVVVQPLPPDGPGDDAFIAQLAGVLEPHTATPDRAWCAVWEGYGWASTSTMYAVARGGPLARLQAARMRRRLRAADDDRNDAVRRGLTDLPTFELPHRRYHLLRCPLAAAGRLESPDGFGHHAPDLLWPDDRSWFVASDTDLDWFYVAGTDELTRDVAAAFPDGTEAVHRNTPNADLARERN